jgi:hypothetical protein
MCFLISCKKKDEVRPELSITSPANNTQYYALEDYILCAGTVSDDVELDRIEFQLQTTSGSPVMPKKIVSPDSNPYQYSYGYFLEDIHLESGSYKMKTEVYDKAGNSMSQYKDVIVYGVPRAKEGVFYISESGGSYTLGRIDSFDVDSTAISVFNDYAGFEINNYDQEMFYMGFESENLLAINTRNYTTDWSLDNQANPPGTYYFNTLNFSSDRYLLVGIFQDEILKRFHNGSGSGNINLNYGNGQPETMYKDGNFVYVESRNIGTGQRVFQRYFFNSGIFDEQYLMDFDFRQILGKGTDELLIFGELAGQAIMKIFYKNGGNFFQPLSLLPGAFVEAFRVDDDNYLIVQDQGVYLYTYSSSNLITRISETNIISADYDELNNQMYLGFANMVKVYSTTGLFIRNIPASGNILNLKVHYNK